MSRKANYTRKSSVTRTSNKTRTSSVVRQSNTQHNIQQNILNQRLIRGNKRIKPPYSKVVLRKYSWDLDIVIPSQQNGLRAVDISNYRNVIVCEKGDIAEALQQTDFVKRNGYYIHVLGGNPLSSVERTSVNENPDGVRRSRNIVYWRPNEKFPYPIVSKDSHVIIVADNDDLGRYIGYHVSKVLDSKNIELINADGTNPSYWEDVLNNKQLRTTIKPIAETWKVSSQSEIGGTITSVLLNENGVIDRYTQQFRNDVKYSKFKKGYLQGLNNANISEIQLSLMSKVLEESLNQDLKLNITLQTESGLETINTKLKAKDIKNIDNVYFKTIKRQKLRIMNTDQTIMQIMRELKINSKQAEEIIKRMATQKIVSYPRTSETGISKSERLSNEELLDVWQYYHAIPQNIKKEDILKRMNELKTDVGKSGLLVIGKTNLPQESLEYRVVQAIAKYNLMAVTNAEILEGNYVFEYTDNEGVKITEKSETVKIINSQEWGRGVGQVIDVTSTQQIGMSEYDLYDFLAKKNIGTPATRSNIINKLEEQGLLLKFEGNYKLDDRARILINAVHIAERKAKLREHEKLSKGFYFLEEAKKEIMSSSAKTSTYKTKKKELYNILKKYVQELQNIDIQEIKSILLRQNKILNADKRAIKLEGDIIEVK